MSDSKDSYDECVSPLPLDDPRWAEVDSSYGCGTVDIRAWLARAYVPRGLSRELIGDLVNEIQHQGDSSSAMYVVAIHFIKLAQVVGSPFDLDLLTHAGWVYACAKLDEYADCPGFAYDDFVAGAAVGARLLAPLLAKAETFSEFQWGVAGLAGFRGESRFAKLISYLDEHEGEFHYMLLDRTIPTEPE